jgi:tetratricopeptide (TPR) repeat protein
MTRSALTAESLSGPAAPFAADPNARSMATNAGKPELLKAYQLTNNATTAEDYTLLIELCREGLEKGVDQSMAVYGRKLTAWAYNRRGEVLADSGAAQQAFEDFDASVSLDRKQWRAVHNRGVSYALLGNPTAAIADFTRAIELNPRFANAWFNRGELMYENRDFAAAVRDYNQVLKLNPQDVAALNSRGHALYRLRRSAEALTDYNRALQIDPTSAASLVNRGDILSDQGRYAEAAKDYRNAIKANPNLGRAYQSAAWLMATCPVEEFRNVELGIEAAQKAIALDGNGDYRYLETLAAAQANAGEYKAAVETQKQALDTAPEAIAQVYKGRIEKYKAGRPHREPNVKLVGSSRAAARR